MNQIYLKEKISKYQNYISKHKKNIKRVENALEILYDKCEHVETAEKYNLFENQHEEFEYESVTVCLICDRIIKTGE